MVDSMMDSDTNENNGTSTSSPNRKQPHVYLKFDFNDSPEWHSSKINSGVLVQYVKEFLAWYRNLPEWGKESIQKAGIIDDFKIQFIHKMCTEEKEGVQSKAETEAISRAITLAELQEQNKCVTACMLQAHKETVDMCHTMATYDSEYRRVLTVGYMNALNKALLSKPHPDQNMNEENEDGGAIASITDQLMAYTCQVKIVGMHRSSGDTGVRAGTHYYPYSRDIPKALNQFIDIFMEMNPETMPKTDEDIANVIKWAAWSLYTLLSLHPYCDANGRLSRLLCNYVLKSIFPFDIPVYNVYNPNTSRKDYLDALINDRQCRCNSEGSKPPASYSEIDLDLQTHDCLTPHEIFVKTQPRTIATIVLESALYACREFCKEVEKNVPDLWQRYPFNKRPVSPAQTDQGAEIVDSNNGNITDSPDFEMGSLDANMIEGH